MPVEERTLRQIRSIPASFNAAKQRRDDGTDDLVIEGYFAVFDSIYEIAPGMTESIRQGAFSKTLNNDVRALINHDTTLVLGRNKANTLELREDTHGLWGKILVNPNDMDAMNLYARVQRGDVSQCSFGFFIDSEETDFRDDGSVHWTITEVTLFEVSCCTFPAYEQTNISARSAERDALIERRLNAWKHQMKVRIHHGTESTDASQETE